MSSVRWYFFMSSFTLSLHLFFGRPLLLFVPETSSLSDFAHMWLGSHLKQWPNHFSILFSRKVSPVLCAPSSRWSNLVFPLAHLNILISAEFSFFSSFFFTAQHSEPYVIAGLMIVSKTLSFNSTGIFLSLITPDTSLHFINPIIILLFTLLCGPPSLVNSDPRYFKDVTVGIVLLFAINKAYPRNIISNIILILILNPWTNAVPHVRSTGNLSSYYNEL